MDEKTFSLHNKIDTESCGSGSLLFSQAAPAPAPSFFSGAAPAPDIFF